MEDVQDFFTLLFIMWPYIALIVVLILLTLGLFIYLVDTGLRSYKKGNKK